MDLQSIEHDHIVELPEDVSPAERSLGRIKTCNEVQCGFFDSKTSSMDAKERSSSMRKLSIAILLCIVFMSVEVAGGIKANSLAIFTDAAHMLLDVAAFAISIFSLWAAGWEATPRHSFGFLRIEILGSLASIIMIWVLAGVLVYEAIERVIHDKGEVQGNLMFLVSLIGLVVNIILAVLLGHDHGHGHSQIHIHGHEAHDHSHNHGHDHGNEVHWHSHGDDHGHSHDHINEAHDHIHDHGTNDGVTKKKRNINLQGAYLHVLGDFIQNIGVMIGGGFIWYKPEWKIIDVICTFVFSAIVVYTTMKMLRNILEVLMESTPREIDAAKLERGLCEMEEVAAIHELHISAITVGKILLSCHVKIQQEADATMVLHKVIGYIKEYNINHVTIQIEKD